MDLYIKTARGFERIPPEMQAVHPGSLFNQPTSSVRDNDHLLNAYFQRPSVAEVTQVAAAPVPSAPSSWELPGPANTQAELHKGYWETVKERADSELNEVASDASIWLLNQLGDIMKELGLWLVKVTPDTLVVLAMMLCLGSILSIPKMGKWAAAATALSVLAEVVRKSTFGV